MRTLLLLLSVGLAAGAARAQGPGPEPGALRAHVAFGVASATEWVDAGGAARPVDGFTGEAEGRRRGAFREQALRLHVAYGLAPHLSLEGSVPLVRRTAPDPLAEGRPEREEADLGTAALGLRLGLSERVGLGERHRLDLRLGVRAPLGYRRNLAPSVGAGQVDAELGVAYGWQPRAVPANLSAEAGYRYRTGLYALSRTVPCPPGPTPEGEPVCFPEAEPPAYGDEAFGRAEVGYRLFGSAALRALAEVTWSVAAPEGEPRTGLPLHPDVFLRSRALRTGVGLHLPLSDNLALLAQVLATPYARHALRTTEWGAGLTLHL